MPGTIVPLPVMLEEQQARAPGTPGTAPADPEPMRSIVVRYGYMRSLGEFPYDGPRVGCGTKLVVRSPRGVELGEMVTTTCTSAGCASAVSRADMLRYIDNSGGRDFPFTENGRVLRVATADDLNEQSRLDAGKMSVLRAAERIVEELRVPMHLVEAEMLLGGERIILHYTAESWVDFRELVKALAGEFHTRIEMHQVNDRDEARIVADYEKCGQHCCCRQFLKVLRPVSMRSAKVQKATLDPTKISGRCGRLMCCLRYEDVAYEDLRRKLPRRNSRVDTPDGLGTVLDGQILKQIVLVWLDDVPAPAGYAVEQVTVLSREEEQRLMDERGLRRPPPPFERDRPPQRCDGTGGPGGPPRRDAGRGPGAAPRGQGPPSGGPGDTPDAGAVSSGYRNTSRPSAEAPTVGDAAPTAADETRDESTEEVFDAGDADGSTPDTVGGDGPAPPPGEGEGEPRRRRRRRGRGRRRDGDGPGAAPGGPPPTP